jgi:hypothetical protein
MHDEDGTAHENRHWPEGLSSTSPATWGQMHFGLPTYTPPAGVTGTSTVTIRHGQNGAVVPDGHVGGGTNCGGIPSFWNTWGNFNYAGDFQMNVQNQWNLGDWGCFSKYYVTFPLDALPANQGILSATLRMYHFGNSLPSEAEPSLIQVFTVDEEWNESTLVWNNAPMAVENVARTWVNPIPAGGTGQYVTWDLSRAVAEAYANGQPLRPGALHGRQRAPQWQIPQLVRNVLARPPPDAGNHLWFNLWLYGEQQCAAKRSRSRWFGPIPAQRDADGRI